MKKLIYRVRPCKPYTIDELRHSYLWFSRPNGFRGDDMDANIGAFVTDTPAIEKGFRVSNPDYPFDKWYELMAHTGICCFTTKLPSSSAIGKYPRCSTARGICIEYDREKLSNFFESHRQYPLHPTFQKVVYDEEPTKLETCDEWSILWGKYDDGTKLYRTIPEILHSHPREFDKFIFKLLTRINSQYSKQHEERIILGGRNIPSHDDVEGYKIEIPSECINRIIVYPKVSKKFKEQLSSIKGLERKIVSISNVGTHE